MRQWIATITTFQKKKKGLCLGHTKWRGLTCIKNVGQFWWDWIRVFRHVFKAIRDPSLEKSCKHYFKEIALNATWSWSHLQECCGTMSWLITKAPNVQPEEHQGSLGEQGSLFGHVYRVARWSGTERGHAGDTVLVPQQKRNCQLSGNVPAPWLRTPPGAQSREVSVPCQPALCGPRDSAL
jgi:hypothetical protein